MNTGFSTVYSDRWYLVFLGFQKLTASPEQSPACLYWCELRDRHLWAYAVVENLRRDLSRISESQMAVSIFPAVDLLSIAWKFYRLDKIHA